MNRAEGAVRGLDAMDEMEMQPLIADALIAGGLGVFREFPVPGPVGRRAKRTERARCDFALTPAPELPPGDPMAKLIEQDAAEKTLFAHAARSDEPPRTPVEDCYWLELKVVGQWIYVDGVPRANTAYASTLVWSIAQDLKKLEAEEMIRFGAVLLVLFTADEEVARHDMPIALHRALDRGVLFRAPITARLEIPDRVGNACCTLAWIPKVVP